MPAMENYLLKLIVLLVFLISTLLIILLLIWHIKIIKKLLVIRKQIDESSVCYCESCGTALPAGMDFCTKCGRPVHKEREGES